MRERSTVITRKGQTTIPAAIRRELGLHEGDRIAWVVERGTAQISREASVTERTRGIVPNPGPPATAEEMRREAEEAIAEETQRRAGV